MEIQLMEYDKMTARQSDRRDVSSIRNEPRLGKLSFLSLVMPDCGSAARRDDDGR